MTIREELIPSHPGYETWLITLEGENGDIGSLKMSKAFGEVFGHDLNCPSSGERLIYAALKKAQSWGATALNVHVDAHTSRESAAMWQRHGFIPSFVVLRREL